MIFIILFIIIYLAIAALVYGALFGSVALHDAPEYYRNKNAELRVCAAVIGLAWPIALCIEEARKDIFGDTPLKF